MLYYFFSASMWKKVSLALAFCARLIGTSAPLTSLKPFVSSVATFRTFTQ